MAGKIFISYRRGDEAGFTQALYFRLEGEFTGAALFMDVEGHIKPGDDFVKVLESQVDQTDVLLAIIGPRWAGMLADRAGGADDFVAIEIEAALDKGKRVIPVLVGGADMPAAATLPEAIRPLARRNAVGLRPERFAADCQGLIAALKESLAEAEKERAARSEAERAEAEAERKAREAAEAARIAAAEERARARSVAGLSPEEVRKAEELANWDFIKEREQPQALRDHMARFPGGVTALYALTRLEDLIWAGLKGSGGIPEFRAFLDEFPKGEHAAAARAKLADLEKAAAEARAAEERRSRETAAWAAASGADNVDAYRAFLKEWLGGERVKAAQTRLRALKTGPVQRRLLIGIGIAGAAMGVAGLLAAVRNTAVADIILVGIMIFSGYLAMLRGLTREMLSIMAWALAALVTLFAYSHFKNDVRSLIETRMLADATLIAAVFIASLIIFSLVTVDVSERVLDSQPGAFDSTLGFVYGLIRGLILVTIAYLIVLQIVGRQHLPRWVTNARSFPLIESVGDPINSLFPDNPESWYNKHEKPASPEP